MGEDIDRVLDKVEPDHVVSLTQDMVRIPTVNPKFVANPALNREADLQRVLDQELSALGFGTEQWDVFPGRPNLVADWPGTHERSLILCGHVDVVPVGKPDAWDRDPFGGEIDNGCIWGRGAVDMKGGLACCIAAARAIREAGIELEGRLSIHAVVDEEAGGFGAMNMVRQGRLATHAIIAEPTWGNVIPAEGGLSWVRVTIFGRQAHAGWRFNELWPQPADGRQPEPGVNAIELANRFLNALRDFEASRCRQHRHPLMPPGLATINPGVFMGGAGLGEDGNPSLLTNAAMIPDVAVIILDYKFMPDEEFSTVKAEFGSFVDHFAKMDPWMREHPPTVEWDLWGLHFPPMNTPTDHPLARAVLEHARHNQASPPNVRGFEAVTDAAHYAGAGVVPVIYGPAGDGFHGDNECVTIDSLVETTRTIAATVLELCGVAGKKGRKT